MKDYPSIFETRRPKEEGIDPSEHVTNVLKGQKDEEEVVALFHALPREKQALLLNFHQAPSLSATIRASHAAMISNQITKLRHGVSMPSATNTEIEIGHPPRPRRQKKPRPNRAEEATGDLFR